MASLIFVLGDQLSHNLSSLAAADKAVDRILMCEVADETTYVRHHKKKIAFIFSAMRHFAETLRADGWHVDYVKLGDAGNTGSFTGEVRRAVQRIKPAELIVTEPGEWRLRQILAEWEETMALPVTILADTRYLCSHAEFASWAEGRKQYRMEYFYRDMRRKTGLLMAGSEPIGGKWNFDSENRKPPPSGLTLPQPLRFAPDMISRDVLALVADKFEDHFGDLEPFWYATTAEQAEQAFEHFVVSALPRFGDFQDAMLEGEKFLYHAVISTYLNAGLLDPLKLCQRVDFAYQAGHVPINAAEGFIRQIIGWREFVRGIYWQKMPDYAGLNFFENTRDLPDFYWTGDTEMACMRAAISQTREEAYAHHIQRLMVTGNFALLAGIDPHQVHEWYLSVYADAYEWVELPNTLGMSQFADGGVLGSKPYAASGNYINKMSNHCKTCRYDVKQKTGEKACPFNPLYWDFLVRNAEKLRGNPRMAQMYRTWDRMALDRQAEYRHSAAEILNTL
ncbi:MAG: cryptochrome/photolyase family protein [Henriciella sp.]